MVNKHYAGSRVLSIVDKRIQSSEGLDGFLEDLLDIFFYAAVSLNRQDLNSIQALKFLFCRLKLGYIASGDDQIGPFLCKRGRDTITDSAAFSV